MKKPLRVLFHFAGQEIDTGSPRALVNHIDVLDRTEIEPWFLATAEGHLSGALRSRGVPVMIDNPSSISYLRPITSLRNVMRFKRQLTEWNVDVLHINELGWNADVAIAAWLLRIPVVLHIHLKETIHYQNLHRFVASAIVLVSEEQRRTIERFDRIRDKAYVIHNPVPLDAFASGHPIRESLGLGDTDFVVGTVAQIRHGKGIDLLIETARILVERYSNLVFIVIGRAGEGREEYANSMFEAAKDPSLHGRVRFLGSRRDIPDLLASMNVFFLPTRIETLSVAVVEAMAAGLPVVTTRVGGMSELIPSAEVGAIVEPPTPERFAATLAPWIDRPEMAKSIGERARASLQGRFDPPSVRRQMTALYQRLVEAKR
jgi:glycosyltransferase involved in cell wall biosynthesis